MGITVSRVESLETSDIEGTPWDLAMNRDCTSHAYAPAHPFMGSMRINAVYNNQPTHMCRPPSHL